MYKSTLITANAPYSEEIYYLQPAINLMTYLLCSKMDYNISRT